jgi:hypothetical protein
MTSRTEEIEEKTEPRDSKQMNRRSFLTGLSAIGVGAGLVGNTGNARAAVGRPFIPNEFRGDEWSTPEELPHKDRDGVIEWSGVKTENEALQQAVGQEHEEYQGAPLWNLYAWTIEQNELPKQAKGDDEWWSGIGIGWGPLNVDSSKIRDMISQVTGKEDDFISQTATDVFTDQVESDYPITVDDTCDDLHDESLWGCYGGDVGYNNPTADIRHKLSFEASHTVEKEWRNSEITYRGFLVVQTYDTDVKSDLNKTFVVTASVFPEEISSVESINDYSFTDDSRDFMKNTR